jgi:hypothetical protein
MSIVIAMVFSDAVVIYADKRAVVKTGNQTFTHDNFLKVHKINGNIICGITGFGEWGLSLIDKLSRENQVLASKVIESVESYHHPAFMVSTVTLAGTYDDGKPFLWIYNTSGKSELKREIFSYSIATDPEQLQRDCCLYFEKECKQNPNIVSVFPSVIKLASERNPKNISSEYDRIILPFKMID